AGVISWAMRLEEAKDDLALIASLPGEKALVRGNHDYWWGSISQLRRCALPRMHFIHNDTLCWRGAAIGGTRLWDFPGISWP
ncbi:MAG: phosphoesterase, partial [Planctomycetota bacterium]|nr:phosphoesterase [Planctomycetota bacterium]